VKIFEHFLGPAMADEVVGDGYFHGLCVGEAFAGGHTRARIADQFIK
jgi:hypothetical protein